MRASLALAPALLLLAGCYAPNPESGTLFCSSNKLCPEGYTCHADDLKCWKKSPADLYVGQWTFGAGSTATVTCTDNSRNVTQLQTNTMDVAYPTTVAMAADFDMTAAYFCSWKLDVATSGQGTMILLGQSCPFTDNGNQYTYHGSSFNFSTADGKTATLTASLAVDGAAVPCMIAVAGTLTRTSP
jgi:hypothetical protein